LIGSVLDAQMINDLKPKIEPTVIHHFRELYKAGDITQGSNLISFEVAKRYLFNFLKYELACINKGDKIKIEAIESKIKATVTIPELPFPIQIVGTIDRVDSCNGTQRIIDYKTSQVSKTELELVNWEDITSDYKAFSKSFQILTYAYLLNQQAPFIGAVEAGIISFKNLKSGLLKFAKKDKPGAYAKKITQLSTETIESYEQQLKNLIIELFDLEVDFIEKEI